MATLKGTDYRPTQKLAVNMVRFVGDQNGPFESLLQDGLTRWFKVNADVQAAYLARIVYPDRPEIGVALCLEVQPGAMPDEEVVEQVRKTFASIFNASEHLDVLFLDQAQRKEIAQVCNPFFRRNQTDCKR